MIGATHVIAASLLLISVTGRPTYRARLPNANAHNVQGSGISCERLGHEGCLPGNATVNQFGKDFRAAGYKYTKEFCEMDSDRDGVSNGAELGDPCCNFVNGGAPSRTTDLSHPGELNSKPISGTNAACLQSSGGGTAATTATPIANSTNNTGIVDETITVTVPADNSTEDVQPTPAANDTEPVCFPADSKVTLENGEVIEMAELKVGDRVLVGPNTYSRVFMFTHALHDVRNKFVSLRTENGNNIELTAGHYIYASRKLSRAADVKLGDTLTLADGTVSKVVNIGEVEKLGLFNPQTVHGNLVVNQVVASTYTEFIASNTAHALLSALRAVYNVFGLSTAVLHGGVESIVSNIFSVSWLN